MKSLRKMLSILQNFIKTAANKYKLSTVLSFKLTYVNLFVSVGDPDPEPDPDPQDQHVFRPSGPDPISQRCGSGSGSGSRSFPFLINVLSGLK